MSVSFYVFSLSFLKRNDRFSKNRKRSKAVPVTDRDICWGVQSRVANHQTVKLTKPINVVTFLNKNNYYSKILKWIFF